MCHGMNNQQHAELDRLERVLAVARRNGNELFIQNIEREIEAVQRGESLVIGSTSQRKNGIGASKTDPASATTGRHPNNRSFGSQGNAP